MSRARRPLQIAAVMGAAMLVATGCGGAEETVPPVDGSATPGATTPGVLDADTGAAPAVDPVTGLPIDPANAGAGATATVPELVGDDVAGGLAPVGSGANFDALAVSRDELGELEKDEEEVKEEAKAEDTAAAVSLTGAKIYVDGIVHSVDRDGTFPKGNPVFRLLSVTDVDIEIALVAGEFTTSGGDGTYLDKGDMVSLVNASEQVTYRVKYLRPIAGESGVSF